MRNLSSVPEQWRTAIRNNGGGFINHIFGTVEEGVKKGFQPRVTLGTNLNQLNLE